MAQLLLCAAVTAVLVAPPGNKEVAGSVVEFRAGEHTLPVYALTVTEVPRWLPVSSAASVFAQSESKNDTADQRAASESARHAVQGWFEEPDFAVTSYSPAELHGQSSGLGWALSYVIAQDPRWLRDYRIATTGVISRWGDVRTVSGLRGKLQADELVGSDVLFVPGAQAVEVRALYQRFHHGASAPLIVGVGNVNQAVEVLCMIEHSTKICTQANRPRWKIETSRLLSTSPELADGTRFAFFTDDDPGLCPALTFSKLGSSTICRSDPYGFAVVHLTGETKTVSPGRPD